MAWGVTGEDILRVEQDFLVDSLCGGLENFVNLCVAGMEWLGDICCSEGFSGITDVVEEE